MHGSRMADRDMKPPLLPGPSYQARTSRRKQISYLLAAVAFIYLLGGRNAVDSQLDSVTGPSTAERNKNGGFLENTEDAKYPNPVPFADSRELDDLRSQNSRLEPTNDMISVAAVPFAEIRTALDGSITFDRATTQLAKAVVKDTDDPSSFFLAAAKNLTQTAARSDRGDDNVASPLAGATAAISAAVDLFLEASSKLAKPIMAVDLGHRIRIHRNVYRLQKAAVAAAWPRQYIRQLDAVVEKAEKLAYPWLISSIAQIEEGILHDRMPQNPITEAKNESSSSLPIAPRGAIYTTGKGHAKYTYLSILNLRHLGSDLPITIMYDGDADLPPAYRHKLETLPGVTTMDLSPYFRDDIVQSHGWSIKPYTLFYAPYKEAIFIDSDVFWFQKPETLFDSDLYKQTGSLFFHDRTLFPDPQSPGLVWFKTLVEHPSARAQELRHWKGKSQHEQESGVVVIDRTRAMLGMAAVCALNTEELRQHEVYQKVHGDKETFWIGYELAREPYSFYPGYGGAIGFRSDQLGKSKNHTVCGGLLHTDYKDRPIWFNGGVQVDKGVQPNRLLTFEHLMTDNDAIGADWAFGSGSPDGFCLSKLSQPAIPLVKEDQDIGSWLLDKWLKLPQDPELTSFWSGML